MVNSENDYDKIMRKEIGSEFWDIPTTIKKNNFFENATWFISGRSALRAILHQITIDNGIGFLKVALPSFLCESMIEPFDIESIEYKFYPVYFLNGVIKRNYSFINDCNVILILDYFGYESIDNSIPGKKIVIRDLTHSLFVKKYDDADYYFGSLRKWAGFIGAGFAFKKNGKMAGPYLSNNGFVATRKKALELKRKYISNEIDSKEYLELFHETEESLEKCKISACSYDDIKSAEQLDVDFIKKTRRENARLIIDKLRKYCLFKNLKKNDCPLCVPILYENRDKLRQYLISKEIYCPIHWPKPKQVNNDFASELYEKELSLVCDQRYTKEDMNRIVNAILSFVESDNNA